MNLYLLLALFGLLAAGMIWMYFSGRRAEKGARAQDAAAVKDRQLEAANQRPRDKEELVDRLREEGL